MISRLSQNYNHTWCKHVLQPRSSACPVIPANPVVFPRRRCEEALGPSELCRPVDGVKVSATGHLLLFVTAARSNKTFNMTVSAQGQTCRERQRCRLVRPGQDEAGKDEDGQRRSLTPARVKAP